MINPRCPQCGREMYTIDEGKAYGCDDCKVLWIEPDDVGDDYIPEGCAACGGDYPNCTDSCPLFDN